MLACLEILANAGGTVFRDADADLKIDDNGDLAAKPCTSAPTCCDRPMRRTCMSAIATLPAYLCNKCERYEQGGLRTESQYWRDTAGGRRAWQDVSEAARVQAESSVAMPVGFTAGGSYVVGDVVSTPTGKFQCAATGAAPAQPCAACGSASTGSAVEDPSHWSTAQWHPWCGSAECRDRIRNAKPAPRETPAESLVRIKRDIASGLLDAKAARAALSRMVYVQHDLKHGPSPIFSPTAAAQPAPLAASRLARCLTGRPRG